MDDQPKLKLPSDTSDLTSHARAEHLRELCLFRRHLQQLCSTLQPNSSDHRRLTQLVSAIDWHQAAYTGNRRHFIEPMALPPGQSANDR